MNEIEEIKMILTTYGMAMYWAACVEQGLIITLGLCWGLGEKELSTSEYDALLDVLRKRTFGSILREARNNLELPNELIDSIEAAVKKRNWLAHTYFWERRATIHNPAGRVIMLEEISHLSKTFAQLNIQLHRLVSGWYEKRGVSEEDLERTLDELTKRATAEIYVP